MSLISISSKKSIESEYNSMMELQKKCESCEILKGKTATNIFSYTLGNADHNYETENGKALIAVSQYDDTYAVYIPKYLSEKQLSVLSFFLHKMTPAYKILVFSQEDLENLKKYSYGKLLNVQLSV